MPHRGGSTGSATATDEAAPKSDDLVPAEAASTDSAVLAEQLKEILCEGGLTVAVAESLTSGALASALGKAPSSADWFVGGVIAYAKRVKMEVLGVADGPLVNRATAEQVARAVGELTGADVAVSTTGVGGPDPKEGLAPGTTWIGVWSERGTHAQQHQFDGEPAEVVEAATRCAVATALEEALALVAARSRGSAGR